MNERSEARRPRVVLVDDSPTMRGVMRELLKDDGRVDVIGEAADAESAVAVVERMRPDVVTMDVMMPGTDGISCVERIMATTPTRVLVVSAAVEVEGAALSMRAVAAGALEVIAKPGGSRDVRAWGRSLAESIRLMAEVPVVTRRGARARAAPAPEPPPVPAPRTRAPLGGFTPPPSTGERLVDAVAIAASTGGPPLLATLLRALRKSPVPVLVAQHLAEGFSAGMARWLSEVAGMAVQVAADGLRPAPGVAYIAPDGFDVVVERRQRGIVLATPAPEGHDRPSADRLLASVAAVYGARAAGVILSGMGDDGAKGLLAMRGAGAVTFAQEPSTCVVAGMPNSALALGAAAAVSDVEGIAAALASLAPAPPAA